VTSPSRDPVQEARSNVLMVVRRTERWRGESSLAAFESALRASLVERVVEGIESAMRHIPSKMTGETATDYRARTNDDQEFNAGLDKALAVLRAELNSGEGGK
jgi:hypothetical protein